jgi:serine/threonine protein kinase
MKKKSKKIPDEEYGKTVMGNNPNFQSQNKKNHMGLVVGDKLQYNGQFYEIIYQIAKGGMGILYKGRNVNTGIHVAVKYYMYNRYYNHEKGCNECKDYFEREKRIIYKQSQSTVNSMHIIGDIVLNADKSPEFYILLEFIDGIPIYQWIQQRFPNPTSLNSNAICILIQKIIMPLAQHLTYVHSLGIVHRDISLENILIVESNNGPVPILIDWGIAKEINLNTLYNPSKPYLTSDSIQSTSIQNVGTAPELRGGLEPVAATDIYMLGHILFFLLTGKKSAFPMVKQDYVLNPISVNKNIDSNLNQIVQDMTQFEPADRIQKMNDVANRLNQYLMQNNQIISTKLNQDPTIRIKSPQYRAKPKINTNIVNPGQKMNQSKPQTNIGHQINSVPLQSTYKPSSIPLNSNDMHILKQIETAIGKKISLAATIQNNSPSATIQNSKVTSLNISNLNRSFLPEPIIRLSALSGLNLSLNNFTEIPKQVFQMRQLRHLNLSKNKISSITMHLDKLAGLTFLDLSSNSLKDLPSTIGNLRKLIFLSILNNPLAGLPVTISSLSDLKTFRVNSALIEGMSRNIRDWFQKLNH